MNKYLFILVFVGTALFSACSSDDLMTGFSPEEERDLVVEAGMDSDIPITLGSMGSRCSGMTRSPLDSEDGLFETYYDPENPSASQYLGVYCLARGKQVDAPSYIGNDIMWSAAYASSYPYANWMTNKPARVKNDGSVEFMKDDFTSTKDYYYPFGNWYQYDFYAYYPRQASVITNARSCSVIINIDGSQDIIWGKASRDDIVSDPVTNANVKAYSSKYLRLTGNEPEFDFDHKLTQFVFYVKPNSASVSQLQTDEIKVTDMKMKEVYKKLKLIIASKDANLTEGVISELSEYGDVKLWNGDTEAFSGGAKPVVPASYNPADESTHKTYIGYAMVPPSALIEGKGHSQFKVYILLKNRTNDTYKEITKVLVPPTGGYVAGRKYEIVLDIH
jgi:hypothetical protein